MVSPQTAVISKVITVISEFTDSFNRVMVKQN